MVNTNLNNTPTAVYPNTDGQLFPQAGFNCVPTANNLIVEAIAAASGVSAIYGATITATPIQDTQAINYAWLCHSDAQAQAQASSQSGTENFGGMMTPGNAFRMAGTAPLWMVGGPNATSLVATVIQNRRDIGKKLR
jgi:hypothetical protein